MTHDETIKCIVTGAAGFIGSHIVDKLPHASNLATGTRVYNSRASCCSYVVDDAYRARTGQV